MSNIIHENKHYIVVVQENEESKKLEYAVINKDYGVVEGTMQGLPYAIGEAEQANSYLEYQMWQWITAQNKRARKEMDEAFVTDAFDATVQ